MTKQLILKIPIDDWAEEYQLVEPNIKDEESFIALGMEGHTPQRLGRFGVVARARGDVDEDILPSNKLMLNAGAAHHISMMFATRKKTVELENGQQVEISEYVARKPHPTNDNNESNYIDDVQPDDKGLVEYLDPLAEQRILLYLERNVMGRIRERLELIAAKGGDVEGIADKLKQDIDDIVAGLI